MDKNTKTAEVIICETTGRGLGLFKNAKEYYVKKHPGRIRPYYILLPEEKKAAIDCFIKELQTPITERGDLYKAFIRYCGTDA